MSLTHLDLFAGIGGFSRAVHWLGGTTVGFVEWDAWTRRVLAKHWPEAHFHGDIRTFTAATLRDWGIRTYEADMAYAECVGRLGLGAQSDARGTRTAHDSESGAGHQLADAIEHISTSAGISIDLITGGYPCQPFSLAGQRLGAEDDRHLWPEMRRVIDLCRPRFVLAENVAGHVTMGLDTVLSDLEADGYACGAVVVPACAVNALHRRDRVWIMAHATCERDEGSRPARHGWPELADGGESMADANRHGSTARVAGSQPGQEGHARVLDHGGPQADTHREPDREVARQVDIGLDGLSAGLVRRPAAGSIEPDLIRAAWADGTWEAGLPRVVAEEPERRQKLQAAGNAIVPLVAYELLRVLPLDVA